MDKITKLENAYHDCMELIKEKNGELEVLQSEIKAELLSIYGLTPGVSRVNYGNDIYIVVSVYGLSSTTKKWLTGYKIKKDGTPGAVIKTIYRWEIIA